MSLLSSTNRNTSRTGIFLVAGALLLFVAAFNFALLKERNDLLLPLLLTVPALALAYVYLFHFRAVLPLLLVAVPCSVTLTSAGGFAIDMPSELLIGITALVFSLMLLRKNQLPKNFLRHPLTILLALEIVWMIICSTTSHFPEVSLKRCVVRIAFLVVFYLLAGKWFSDPAKQPMLFVLYGAGCIFPSVYTLVQHAHFNFRVDAAYAMCRPFFADHTIFGAVLAFVIPGLLLLLFNRRLLGLNRSAMGLIVLALLTTLAAEIFSFSRAAWMSLVIALVFYFLIRLRMRLWMLLTLLSVMTISVSLLSNRIIDSIRRNEAVSNKGSVAEHLQSVTNIQSDASNLERVNRWAAAIRMAQDRPFTGFGPGTYQFEYGRYQVHTFLTRISTFNGNRGHAHSEFFTALSETGFPGLLLFTAIMFTVIGYGLKVIYRSADRRQRVVAIAALLGLITFYVHGFFNAFLDTDKMAALVFGAIAILVSIDLKQKSIES